MRHPPLDPKAHASFEMAVHRELTSIDVEVKEAVLVRDSVQPNLGAERFVRGQSDKDEVVSHVGKDLSRKADAVGLV